MGSLSYLICIHLAILQTVYSQCANRVVQSPNGPIELLPNQVLVPPSGVPYLGPLLPPSLQGRVYLPGAAPCKTPASNVILPATPEYANIANLGPVLANLAPITLPNVLAGQPSLASISNALGNVVVPGNIVVPNTVAGNVVVPSGNVVVPSGIVPEYAPTIIHDNSVANSLANALQLLVVSSLLGNTLPTYEPPYYEGCFPGYNYIY